MGEFWCGYENSRQSTGGYVGITMELLLAVSIGLVKELCGKIGGGRSLIFYATLKRDV